jgi:hypothetical protein
MTGQRMWITIHMDETWRDGRGVKKKNSINLL